MPSTSVYGLPYQALSDPPNGPTLGQNLAQAIESLLQGNLTLGANLTAPGDLSVGGNATITGSLTVASATVGGISTASRPRGVLARGRRTTNTTASTGTETPFLRLDDVPISSGRLIKITAATLMHIVTLDNETSAVILRYTTDGSTPTTASTILTSEQVRQPEADFGLTNMVIGFYAPAGNETLSVLASIKRVSGTSSHSLLGSATQPIDLIIEDVGADPGNTGTSL
jgi:hypothetical protein